MQKEERRNLTRKPDAQPARPELAEVLSALAVALEKLAGFLGDTPTAPTVALLPSRPALRVLPIKESQATRTVAEAVNEFLVSKASAGCRERYLKQLRHTLNVFARAHLAAPLASITPGILEAHLTAGAWKSSGTRRNHLIDLRTFFAWCERRQMIAASPASAVDKPRREDKAPGIHTPEQVQRILDVARHLDRDVCRLLAVQYFTGLRPSEAAGLTEERFLPGGYIEVTARFKSRRRRLVTIKPPLDAWLALGGSLPVGNLKRRWLAVRKAAGEPWPHDVTRHSFASYHLAAHRSADVTAVELGHRSTAMLFEHYRELVTPEQAAAFFAVRPA